MTEDDLLNIEKELSKHFNILIRTLDNIKEELNKHSDGKALKGDEIVGWLGEIYGKTLLNGKLVPDNFEHDFETKDGKRISVKTRKGKKSGWNRTSGIPKIDSPKCPTHLMFIHLEEDYSLNKIWLYPWEELIKSDRFEKHIVRGNLRSYRFQVKPNLDKKYMIYQK